MGDVIDFEKEKQKRKEAEDKDREQESAWERIKRQWGGRIPEDDDGN